MKHTAVIIMIWCCVEITFLILITNLYNMSVFLTFKTLYKIIIFIIKLAIFEFTLKEQFLVNECINLHWQSHIYNQIYYYFVKLDSFLESLHVQNLNSFLEIFILFHKLLYYFFENWSYCILEYDIDIWIESSIC